MSDTRIIRAMRCQAWERAKGELNSMLHTFWLDTSHEGQFDELDKAIKAFVSDVEGHAMHE